MGTTQHQMIVQAATALFEGDKQSALAWLDEPALGLGGMTPNEAIALGREQAVLDLIGKVESGVVI